VVKASEDAWHVYILECADGTLYTGATNDVPTRVERHNRGRGAKYTRSRLPVGLVYVETAGRRGAALRREREIKRLTRAAKRRLIAQSPSPAPKSASRAKGPPRD
jgi:putative endonuclease